MTTKPPPELLSATLLSKMEALSTLLQAIPKDGNKLNPVEANSTLYKFSRSIDHSKPLWDNLMTVYGLLYLGGLPATAEGDNMTRLLWEALRIVSPEIAACIKGGPYDPRTSYESFNRFVTYIKELKPDDSEDCG